MTTEPTLQCYQYETTFAAAYSPQDAADLYIRDILPDDDAVNFELVDPNTPVSVDTDTGEGTVVLPAHEWVAREGRGIICSGEW